MITNFNEQLWFDFDLEIAVLLENLSQWVRFNATKENPEHRNYRAGRYWSFDSYKELAKRFQGWSAQTIRRIIKRASDAGLIIIGNFNQKKYDNTNWYTLSDAALDYFPKIKSLYEIPLIETDNQPVEIDKPIPEALNSLSIITNNNTNSRSKTVKGNELLQELIGVYRNVFPNNPQPHEKLISTSLEKTLRTLIKRWPEADPNGEKLTVDAFRRYMIGLKSLAPRFALGEYLTLDGNKKKNGLETFARWNTFVKFLEGQYS